LRFDLIERDLLPRLLRVPRPRLPPDTESPVVFSIDSPASFAMLVALFNVSDAPFDTVLPKLLKYSDQVFLDLKKLIL
jgi:hypothetical protein